MVTEILGDNFDGIASNDRAKAYLVLDPNHRQACWFHLSRNFQSKIERGQAATFGKRMRAFEKRLFKAEKLRKSGEIDEKSNNRAERDIRHAVVWRRSSFGTNSPTGSRFVERILTVVETCKRQGRRGGRGRDAPKSAAPKSGPSSGLIRSFGF